MKFSTFHSFMLTDAKGVAPDHLLEGQRVGSTHHRAIRDELALIRAGRPPRVRHLLDARTPLHRLRLLAQHDDDGGPRRGAHRTDPSRYRRDHAPAPSPDTSRRGDRARRRVQQGRVDVGIGRGYQSVEFDAFAVPLDEARSRTDEAIQVIRRAVDRGSRGSPRSLLGLRRRASPAAPGAAPLSPAVLRIGQRGQHHALRGARNSVHRGLHRSHRPLGRVGRPLVGVVRAHDHDTEASELVAVRYVCLDDSDDAAREYVALGTEGDVVVHRSPAAAAVEGWPHRRKATSTGKGLAWTRSCATTAPMPARFGRPVGGERRGPRDHATARTRSDGHRQRGAVCSGSRPPRRRPRDRAPHAALCHRSDARLAVTPRSAGAVLPWLRLSRGRVAFGPRP